MDDVDSLWESREDAWAVESDAFFGRARAGFRERGDFAGVVSDAGSFSESRDEGLGVARDTFFGGEREGFRERVDDAGFFKASFAAAVTALAKRTLPMHVDGWAWVASYG